MSVAYYLAEALLVLVSIALPRFNRITLTAVALVLFVASGARTGGFDYQNYVDVIEYVRQSSSKGVLFQLALVKDPLMLGVIHLCGFFSQGTRLVFFAMAALAVLPKAVVATGFRDRSALFLGVYAIFLAPGLEFEAMRAAVALGFVMLLFMYVNRGLVLRWSVAAFAVASHITALPILASRLLQKAVNTPIALAALPAIVALAAYASSSILWIFPRSEDYQNNTGTAMAFLPPCATYVAYLITNAAKSPVTSLGPAPVANIAAALAIGFGIGLAPVAVTVAFRFLEYGWAVVAFVAFARDGQLPQTSPPRLSYHMVAFALLAFTMVTANALRDVLVIPL